MTQATDREILLALIKSISIDDTLGDVHGHIGEAMKMIGLGDIEWDDSDDLFNALGKAGFIDTLYDLKARDSVVEKVLLEKGVEVPDPTPPVAPRVIKENPAGDWPEDFDHENGNYSCTCMACGSNFSGHKRRMICRYCHGKTHFALFQGESQISKPHSTREAAVTEAFEKGAVVTSGVDFPGDKATGLGLSDGFSIRKVSE